MPCQSDYLAANDREIEYSRVLCLLGELEGKPWPEDWWRGYHPQAYGHRSFEDLDVDTAALCAALSTTDVTKYSLDMQVWWRDHQEADRRRKLLEMAKANRQALIDSARAKLTIAEQRALGLEIAEPEPPGV